MIAILLQRGGGSWLPLLWLLVALVVILKGGQLLFQYIKARRLRHKQLSAHIHEGIMDEYISTHDAAGDA